MASAIVSHGTTESRMKKRDPRSQRTGRARFKRAFDHCATDYAQHRPAYPKEVFDLLAGMAGPPTERLCADIGAGTGIFSRALVDNGWRVVAIDPSAAMLSEVNESRQPDTAGYGIARICATAEATPLRTASVDLVTAAQSFHWFNPPYALAEFARVLSPSGTLAILWNNRDADRSPVVEQFEQLVARYNRKYDREYRVQDWAQKIAACGAFDRAHHHRFQHTWRLSAEALVGFTRSVSYIRNVIPTSQRPKFERDLLDLVERHFGPDDCRIPLNTDIWTARKTVPHRA